MTRGGTIHFVETMEHRRFVEFCQACERDRYIGLCYGPPGVGKTMSAGRFSGWEKMRAYQDDSRSRKRLANAQVCKVVFYTPAVVNTPKIIERDIKRLRYELTELRRELIRAKAEPRVQRLQQEIKRNCYQIIPSLRPRTVPDRELTKEEQATSIRAEQEMLRLQEEIGEELVEVSDPTALIVIDEADRLKEFLPRAVARHVR